jgi:virginiamycin B lyase
MISEFPTLTPFSTPSGIITGPDGALWFAELGSFKIGRITTSGSFSEFPLATPSDRPDGIAVGPDGALWFTERAVGKIGRVTTGGSFTEFPVPTAGSVPDQITAGPDGAIWFTMNYSKIGRITVPPTTLTLSPKRRAMTSAPRTA